MLCSCLEKEVLPSGNQQIGCLVVMLIILCKTSSRSAFTLSSSLLVLGMPSIRNS